MFCIYSTMTNHHLTKKGCPTRHRFVICMGHTKSESLFWNRFLCIGLSVAFPHIANLLMGTTHLITSSWFSCASIFWFRRHFLALPCWYPCSVPPLPSLSAFNLWKHVAFGPHVFLFLFLWLILSLTCLGCSHVTSCKSETPWNEFVMKEESGAPPTLTRSFCLRVILFFCPWDHCSS